MVWGWYWVWCFNFRSWVGFDYTTPLAYKHAFKDMEDGHIWTWITDLGEHFELQIEDNGNGGGSELSPKQFS